MKLIVDNIKCGGCAGTITKKLEAVFQTQDIEIDIEQGVVNINVEDDKRDKVAKVLLELGYPETDSVHGFDSAKAKAKSFVSCAIGKMDQ